MPKCGSENAKTRQSVAPEMALDCAGLPETALVAAGMRPAFPGGMLAARQIPGFSLFGKIAARPATAAVRAAAIELMRQDSYLTLAEAIAKATEIGRNDSLAICAGQISSAARSASAAPIAAPRPNLSEPEASSARCRMPNCRRNRAAGLAVCRTHARAITKALDADEVEVETKALTRGIE